MRGSKISVIIPTLNAEAMIDQLLTRLENQYRTPDEIIVIDSSSDDKTVKRVQQHPDVKLLEIQRKDFNHGGSRDYALRKSSGDYVLFLTQDALPKDTYYIHDIIQPFRDEAVALVYGRQVPRSDARAAEKMVREYTYGEGSYVVTREDIPRMGIKAFRATDVCAAYRRSAYLEVGGFDNPVLTNEDMFIAARFLKANWKVVYEAEAEVIHSHNFTLMQQYKRNYIQGFEIEKHRAILGNVPLTGEGISMMTYTMKGLLKHGKVLEMGRFAIDCAFRYIGNKKGEYDAKYNRTTKGS